MRSRKGSEAGAVLVLVALLLLLLLSFVALGVEAGRWFLVRAELSKTVDAAALAAARNISNPHVDPVSLATELTAENFPPGHLGTPVSGVGSPRFDIQLLSDGRFRVEGHASAIAIFGRWLGLDMIPIASVGVAQKKQVEIMLVLDRSGSMSGTPISDLKRAAGSFLDFFADTQNDDRAGLVSFATSVQVERALGSNFVTPMKAAVDAMSAVGATNAEDAIARAGGPQGFTDQSGVPADRRVRQFLVFFSDGRPTAFRGTFKKRGTTYDAVGCVTGNCGPGEIGNTTVTYGNLGEPDREAWLGIDPRTTGDGNASGSRCGTSGTTRWNIFDARPVPGHGPEDCGIPYRTELASHVCNLASSLALQHAQELKDRGIAIYAIGLGQVNRSFLEQLATDRSRVYYAPTSDQLEALFQEVARQIKLRLVQ